MNAYRATFSGRQTGAIGQFYRVAIDFQCSHELWERPEERSQAVIIAAHQMGWEVNHLLTCEPREIAEGQTNVEGQTQ